MKCTHCNQEVDKGHIRYRNYIEVDISQSDKEKWEIFCTLQEAKDNYKLTTPVFMFGDSRKILEFLTRINPLIQGWRIDTYFVCLKCSKLEQTQKTME